MGTFEMLVNKVHIKDEQLKPRVLSLNHSIFQLAFNVTRTLFPTGWGGMYSQPKKWIPFVLVLGTLHYLALVTFIKVYNPFP